MLLSLPRTRSSKTAFTLPLSHSITFGHPHQERQGLYACEGHLVGTSCFSYIVLADTLVRARLHAWNFQRLPTRDMSKLMTTDKNEIESQEFAAKSARLVLKTNELKHYTTCSNARSFPTAFACEISTGGDIGGMNKSRTVCNESMIPS